MSNNYVKKCILLLIIIFTATLNSAGIQVMASETKDDAFNNSIVPIDFNKTDERLEEGYLDVPEKFRQELFLYQCITETVDRYVAENNIDDTFYFDLKEDWLYGSRKFKVTVGYFSTEIYEYPIYGKEDIEFEEGSYQFRVEGKKDTLYIEIDFKEKKVYLYPESGNYVQISYPEGNEEAFERMRKEGKNFLDAYVKSDWDNLEMEDNHLAGIPYDEIGELDYLIIPKNISFDVIIYLDVACALKRYMEENQIEDVFYFDANQDIVSSVTSSIFTCRVRGTSRTLYIDIGIYSYEDGIRCHVYQVEE